MPKIIINQKFCDQSPECSGIEICPNQALSFDSKSRKIIWDETKCTFCLKCTLPSVCPVGAILYARDISEEKTILSSINSDPHSSDWLWEERFGVMPAKSDPQALILNPTNFKKATNGSLNTIIDIWHQNHLDCRLHSPLFSDILAGVKNIPTLYKLDAALYPELAKKLGVSIFPTMLIYYQSQLAVKIEGLMTTEDVSAVNHHLLHLFE